jgi:gluconokinase
LNDSLVLALDIGTSSVRAALYDSTAKRLDDTFVKNERAVNFTDEGGAELDAEAALAQVEQAIADVFAKAGNSAAKIEHVTASCFWHSLVGVDENGKALTPLLTWADTRSAKCVETLKAHFDESETHNRTGCRFHPSYWTAKLLWLHEEQPEVFAKVDQWLTFGDFFALRFFGEAATSVSQASGTGIFDVRRNDWDEEMIDFLGVRREQLPRIAGDDETFVLKGASTKLFQKLVDAKWFLAIGDGAANNVGANCVTGEKAALMIGTSGAMRVIYGGEPPAKIPDGLWCYRLDRKRVIVGGALSDGGGLYRWLKDTLKLVETDDEIEKRIARNTPDCHGLTFLPFLAGERSTNWNANARGAILGLNQNTSPVEITQAALESIAYRFAAIFAELCAGVCDIKEIIASGGALRESPVWTQIICDTLNKPMFLPDEREASSRGAVLYALEKAGIINNLSEIVSEKGQEFTPDSAKHEIYKKARQRQEKFHSLISKATE